MEFKRGTPIYTSDGKHIGSIERVVLDPRSDKVTDLVIHEGRIFTTDKVVAVELIASATSERVTLRRSEHDLPSLPIFEETYYVPTHKEHVSSGDFTFPEGYAAASVYGYPPLGVAWWGFGGEGVYLPIAVDPEYRERLKENIPEGTVAVKEGARVISREGKHIGNVEEVFTDSATNRATHLVISQGLLFKERKLIPTNWIRVAAEDAVILTVGTQVVHDLPGYEAQKQ